MHRTLVASAVVAVGVAGLGAAGGAPAAAPSAAAQKKVVVDTARSKRLKRTILVNRRGRTLYSLSAERNGRFICTDSSCLSFWTPLVVAAGTRPTGARSLGTVKRPDGKTQVSYRGRPLYTFYEDSRSGDVNGEGFEDVGIWHAAVVRDR